MKICTSFLLLAGFFFAGCGNKESARPATTNASSGNPLTAPVDYLGAIGKAKQSAEKTISGTSFSQAVNMFSAQEGRFPKDLNELVPAYLPSIPPAPTGMKYSYDPKTGMVKVVPK
jgi:hypothetical protein